MTHRKAGMMASSNATRGQIISARRPNRSESAPPSTENTAVQPPTITVAEKASAAFMCSVVEA